MTVGQTRLTFSEFVTERTVESLPAVLPVHSRAHEGPAVHTALNAISCHTHWHITLRKTFTFISSSSYLNELGNTEDHLKVTQHSGKLDQSDIFFRISYSFWTPQNKCFLFFFQYILLLSQAWPKDTRLHPMGDDSSELTEPPQGNCRKYIG